jgi:hypothetical protein
LKKNKTRRIIDDLLDSARSDYQIQREAIRNLEEIDRMLDDPLLVHDKKMATDICGILIKLLTGGGVVKAGSIVHRLALRLLDYILRIEEETAGKNGAETGEDGS